MSEQGKFLLYTAKEGAAKVEIFFQGETVWLTQKALAELFGVKRPAITRLAVSAGTFAQSECANSGRGKRCAPGLLAASRPGADGAYQEKGCQSE
jgi:hypothetical protein